VGQLIVASGIQYTLLTRKDSHNGLRTTTSVIRYYPGIRLRSIMSKASADYWTNANAAQLYKDRERLTGSIARCLIQQVGLLQAQKGPLIVLDNACGTGVLSSLLYEMLDESAKERLQLTCGDFSEAMVQSTQQRIINSGWKGAKAQVVDAQV